MIEDGWYTFLRTGSIHYVRNGTRLCGGPGIPAHKLRSYPWDEACPRCRARITDGWYRSKMGKMSHYFVGGRALCWDEIQQAAPDKNGNRPKCDKCKDLLPGQEEVT